MKSIKLLFTLALIMILLPAADGFSCTMVMAAKNDMVLVGNNEDCPNCPNPKVTFIPAAADRFGCISFGFEDGSPEGGMNDQGLFFDGNGVDPTGWRADPAKPTFKLIGLHILQTCANLADVRTFFETNNVPILKVARIPFADRSGASMVVEYAGGKVRFVTETTWYQISTNFLRTNYPGTEVPCNRFRVARQIMDSAGELNVPLIRSVIDATHQDFTVYSNIYDLKAGLVYVYRRHNFKEELILNLDDELKKGARTVKLSDLYPKKPAPTAKPISVNDGK